MKKIYFVFIGLVILMIGLSVLELRSFISTKEKIKTDMLNELLINVESVAKNITHHINLHELNEIKINPYMKEEIDRYLQSFITNNYKNVFIVYPKTKKFFIALADGSQKEKFDFKEKFEPLNKKYWAEVLHTKKPVYFKQEIKNIWMTFLYPYVKDGKIKYIVVIDFSTKPLLLVNRNLDVFKSNVVLFSGIILISMIILISFLVYDYKRQQQMQNLLSELKILNDTLEEKVKDEVEKNRQKDHQLLLQSRLALMGELLSMIAHQWRQPLNSIGGIVSNIKLDIAFGELNEEKIKIMVDKIEKLILHLSNTIDDFSKFYREESESDFTQIAISKVVNDSLNIILPSLQNHHVDVKVNIIDDKIVYIMPNRLKQVLLNIIKNALDALNEKTPPNPMIEINVFDENKQLIIEIKDNAGGIPEELIDKIFDPYFTTKDEKNGTGIGLYMSKMIIERMLGHLSVYNYEKGAIFRIDLKEA